MAHNKRRQDEQWREGFSLSSAPGKVVAANIKPKLTGGKRKIIDETFKADIEYKDADDAQFSIP